MKCDKNKIIRDVVHGDIYFTEKFLKLIDTREFQRLHRIKQLSTAYMLFPSAVHTRFSHSIGTYYVMNKLIEHFEKIFRGMDITISEEHKNLALCAALLHDIGHGPFSHAFENAFPEEIKIDNHEKWSVKIIKSEETEINQVLRKEFGQDFPQKISCLIEQNFINFEGESGNTDINIFKILSLLISSNLDADRMDYLLRDAFFTSVTNGVYDLDRLVNALNIDIKDNQMCICVKEKYISTLEEYVLARYHMNKEVYLHPIKCEMELIVKKIFYRLYELYKKNIIKINCSVPKALINIFNKSQLRVKDYVELDDSLITCYINEWSKLDDDIIKTLCNCFLNRCKYRKLNLMENSEEDVQFFKKSLIEILPDKYSIKDFDNEYFWIECNVDIEIYKNKKDSIKNILIRKNNGVLFNITDISNIINKYNVKVENDESNEKGEKKKMLAFINESLFNKKFDNMEYKLSSLIKNNESRHHIEIEKKYVVNNKEIFESIEKAIIEFDSRYVIKEINTKPIVQTDFYYDTSDNRLYKQDKTLRIRQKNDKMRITIKKPVDFIDSSSSQRFEFEQDTNYKTICENDEFVSKHLPELVEELNDNLVNRVVIENNRKEYEVKKGDIIFEMVFDDIKFYEDLNKRKFIRQEYEVEIELKSDYSHRVNLYDLTTHIEKKLGLTSTRMSKYKRVLKSLVE